MACRLSILVEDKDLIRLKREHGDRFAVLVRKLNEQSGLAVLFQAFHNGSHLGARQLVLRDILWERHQCQQWDRNHNFLVIRV